MFYWVLLNIKIIIMKMTHFFKLPILAVTTLVVLNSCKDDETPPPPAGTDKAKVLITHASPNAPNVDLFVNGGSIATGVAFLANTGYKEVNAGATNIKVNATGTTTSAINADVTLVANKNYSVFAIDSLSKIKAAVVTDDLTAPAAGKAHVRFFHFSPNAPSVDIKTGTGASLFAARTFNDQATTTANQAFTPVDTGTITIQVFPAGGTTSVLSIPNVSLSGGKIYTIYARGFLGGTGAQALGATIIANN